MDVNFGKVVMILVCITATFLASCYSITDLIKFINPYLFRQEDRRAIKILTSKPTGKKETCGEA